MFRICRMGFVFLKNSKMLTLSAILSIFFACFLGISMFQLSSCVEKDFEQNVLKESGYFDIQVSKEGGEVFTKEEMEFIRKNKGVARCTKGYQIVEIEDIYIVGVVDDEINKSLYKYSEKLNENDIVISASLSRRVEKKVGDDFSIVGKEFRICEVLEDNPMEGNKLPMVIMELTQLHMLLGNEDMEQANYMLLQCEENVKADTIVKRIEDYNPNLYAEDLKGNEELQRLLTIVKSLLTTLFVIVIIISGLFVVSIFQEYMRKYRKDMAIIRTVGGKQWQVSAIFCSMCMIISATGCLAGTAASALFSDVLLNWFNESINLFSGTFVINWWVLWGIAVIVFVTFNLFVGVFFAFGQSVLPIQVFQETSTGLRKKKNGGRFLEVRRIIGTEAYLGIKLMIPKLLQNILIVFIIALITTFSYIGQASMRLLEANNTSYYYGLMHGKDAYGEILTSFKSMTLSKVLQMDNDFENITEHNYTIYGEFDTNTYENDGILSFSVTDTEEFLDVLGMNIWEQLDEVPKDKRAILEESLVKEKGYKLGDIISIDSDSIGGKKDFVLVGIVPEEFVLYVSYGVIVDWDNLCLPSSPEYGYENNECQLSVYLDGDIEKIKEKFFQLEKQYREFSWYIYEDVMEQSDIIMEQRLAMIKIVMVTLLIIAGIGWLNSAKGMLMARQEEYRTLHMLGTTIKRVRRISWIQVWSYMSSGIILGVVFGIVLVYNLWKSNLNTNVSISIYWDNILGIVMYIFILSLFLKPTIDKSI